MASRRAHNARRGRSSSQLCRPEKRQRIYARDGWACLWCGLHVSAGARLTLDHFLPRALGGDNATDNLFTACSHCNSKRQHTPALTFAAEIGNLFGDGWHALERICAALGRPLPTHVP